MIAFLAGAVTWFPQDRAHLFYVLKGVIALIATVGLIVHMSHTWHQIVRWGQRLRYLSLLAFAFLITGATIEQLEQDAVVNYRNLGTFVCALLLLVAVAASIRDDVMHKQPKP